MLSPLIHTSPLPILVRFSVTVSLPAGVGNVAWVAEKVMVDSVYCWKTQQIVSLKMMHLFCSTFYTLYQVSGRYVKLLIVVHSTLFDPSCV
jgi:hypothetical protein